MIINIFASEISKLKRSLILYIHLFVLVLFPTLIGFYYKNRIRFMNRADVYSTFYELLAIASPIMIGIIICLVFDREEKVGNFKNWSSMPINKTKIMQIQLLFYWILYLFEILVISLIFYAFVGGTSSISILKIITINTLFSILSYALYQISFILSLRWGISGALICGIFGVILSFLGITSLLDNFWVLVPWTWQIRTIIFLRVKASLQVLNVIKIEYLICIGITALITFLSILYCKKWER